MIYVMVWLFIIVGALLIRLRSLAMVLIYFSVGI